MNETVKGFKDYLGEEAEKREKVREIIKSNFEKFGFEPVETPVIEYADFVIGENASDEAVSDTFKLKDKGDRNLALRYEFTFQLKRIIQNKKLPYKRYQIGLVFRDEPATGNRVRQITQCDADIIGSNIKDETEILSLVSNILKELGIKAEIYVNNRALLNEILEEQGIKKKEEVIREIDKLDKLPEKKVKENLKQYGADKIISILKKKPDFFSKYKAYKNIQELEKYCKLFNVKIVFQPNLARGLSYYNGSVFEIKSKDMKETISAGGSYLVNGIQAAGISLGLDRISQLAKIKDDKKSVLVISFNQDDKAIKLVSKIRASGTTCEIMYGKPTKALEYANSKNLNYVVFLGGEEVKQKKVKLKDMKSGKEQLITEKDLIKKLTG